MTEQTDGTLPPPTPVDAEVVPMRRPPRVTPMSGRFRTPEGELRTQRIEIWNELDANLSDDEVASIVEELDYVKLMYGVDNVDRPQALTEWILRQAHITVEWRHLRERELAYKKALASLAKRLENNPKAQLSEAQEKLRLTYDEEALMKKGESVSNEVKVTVETLDDIKTSLDQLNASGENEEGLNLLDILDGYEHIIGAQIAPSNTIRIYNKLYDKLYTTDGRRQVPSPDLIITGRILLMFMKGRLGPTDVQSE